VYCDRRDHGEKHQGHRKRGCVQRIDAEQESAQEKREKNGSATACNEATQLIRSSGRRADTPIIAVTASAMAGGPRARRGRVNDLASRFDCRIFWQISPLRFHHPCDSQDIPRPGCIAGLDWFISFELALHTGPLLEYLSRRTPLRVGFAIESAS
jgi:hypothetical protein